MKKTNPLVVLTAIAFALLISCNGDKKKEEAKEAPLPNIVLILADDLGYGDISFLNSDSKINTPNIDRIGKEGIFFADAHSPSAVCTPTRYGLLTGQYAFRTHLKSGVLWGYSDPLIEKGQTTLAGLLKKKGYQTGVVGKWHLGLQWSKKTDSLDLYEGTPSNITNADNVDYQAGISEGPNDRGFDYSFINPASLDMAPYVYLENQQVTAPVSKLLSGENEVRGVFWRTGDVAEDFIIDKTLDTFTDKAVGFINEQAAKSTPFFLYFPLTAPHTPWLPGEQFKGTTGAGTYGDFVAHVDYITGQVLEALDKNGITNNTLIIFTSDNGAHWTTDDKAQYPHLANHHFRGMKSDVWEGGHRVPFLVKWPGVIKPGTEGLSTICHTDFMATLAELTGQEKPATAEDSYSFFSSLKGNTQSLRPYTIHHSVNGTFALRKGEWKLVESNGSGGWSFKGEEGMPKVQLYNMKDDPSETNNLQADFPEVVNELQGLLDKARAE